MAATASQGDLAKRRSGLQGATAPMPSAAHRGTMQRQRHIPGLTPRRSGPVTRSSRLWQCLDIRCNTHCASASQGSINEAGTNIGSHHCRRSGIPHLDNSLTLRSSLSPSTDWILTDDHLIIRLILYPTSRFAIAATTAAKATRRLRAPTSMHGPKMCMHDSSRS